MLQLDFLSDSALPAPMVAQPKHGATKAPEKPLLSKRDLHHLSELTTKLTPEDRARIESYGESQLYRASRLTAERAPSREALAEQLERFALGAAAAAAALLRRVDALRAEVPAEPAPASTVQPTAAPAKKRGRPKKSEVATPPAPVKNARAEQSPKPPKRNDITAAAMPPAKVVLAPEQVVALPLINIPRRPAMEA